MAETSQVRVIIRVRGFFPNEVPAISSSSKNAAAEEVAVCLKDPHSCRNESYNVDSFYGQEENDDGKSNVRQIFEREVMPLIPGVVNGSNATVFSYGATGSGKTFTMQGSDELPGLMPMATSTILSMCENTQKIVEISYYEIYLERCYDLLDVNRKEISILEDKDGHPHFVGLSKVLIHSMNDFEEAFFRAELRRKVSHMSLNDVSSRSHGVLVIYASEGPGSTLTGKLNLIDLSGNEDNSCGNEGVRLTGSTKINQSLFALSQVIYALNDNTRVPYRDSKLTRILQDSLGGTSHALMVACLNPREYEHSVHTVSLAARSRRISNFCHSAQKHNTPEIQVEMEAKLHAWLDSKGKTKSARRKDPTLPPTPCSIRSMKKCSTFKSSGKPKAVRTLEPNARKVETVTTPICKESKVLSPINHNAHIDPVTSEQQSFIEDKSHKTENTVTPLSKLKSVSCNLKSTLSQEYINFLNTAEKIELMQLKEIGEKRADYILELRDASPLESLNDLEKIGLSSKQVNNMFGSTAKWLLGGSSVT